MTEIGAHRIPIAQPLLGQAENDAVQEVLASGELVQGRWVARFEEAFAEFCGARFAIAISSGTTALHVALLAHGVGPGDEVITTPFTFVATGNAILYVGAKPVFVDIEPDTFNIDANAVERAITEKTRAVLPVDLYGHPADLPRLAEICERHGLALVEDACQAHGAQIAGMQTGSVGTGCFSFYPSKNMTTIEGGMVTTDNEEVAATARLLRQHGARQPYVHDVLGFNFRMTNVNAAIGIVQLGRLREFNERRIDNAAYYSERLPSDYLSLPVTRPGARHVFHQYTLRVPERRDEFMRALDARNIDSRVYYPVPLHRQPLYVERGLESDNLPESDRAASEVLALPVHPKVSHDQLDYIIDAVSDVTDRLARGAPLL